MFSRDSLINDKILPHSSCSGDLVIIDEEPKDDATLEPPSAAFSFMRRSASLTVGKASCDPSNLGGQVNMEAKKEDSVSEKPHNVMRVTRASASASPRMGNMSIQRGSSLQLGNELAFHRQVEPHAPSRLAIVSPFATLPASASSAIQITKDRPASDAAILPSSPRPQHSLIPPPSPRRFTNSIRPSMDAELSPTLTGFPQSYFDSTESKGCSALLTHLALANEPNTPMPLGIIEDTCEKPRQHGSHQTDKEAFQAIANLSLKPTPPHSPPPSSLASPSRRPSISSGRSIQPDLMFGIKCPRIASLRLDPSILDKVFENAEGLEHPHLHAIPGYSIGKVIGSGGFCQVRLGVHHLSTRLVAIKVFDKRKFGSDEERLMRREIRVMKHLAGYDRCISLYETLEKDRWTYLVLEYAPNGMLFDYVKRQGHLSAIEAARILDQLSDGLIFCHSKGVAHRDIKLENVMLDEDNGAKLIDWGLAAFCHPGVQLTAFCGSPSYAPPEIIAHRPYNGLAADVWSLGVLFFGMLVGHLPFYSSPGQKDLDKRILEGKFRIASSVSKDPLAKDLIERMLAIDPNQRILMAEVKQHPWLVANCPPPTPAFEPVSIDEHALAKIETALGLARKHVLSALVEGEMSDITAHYFLLAKQHEDRRRAERMASLHAFG